jgi:hypothetical protein
MAVGDGISGKSVRKILGTRDLAAAETRSTDRSKCRLKDQNRLVIQSSRISLSSQLGSAARRLDLSSRLDAATGPFNFSSQLGSATGRQRRWSRYGIGGPRCGTPFGFSAAPTRRMPCRPLSSRTAGERADHCPVASQATAKTATSGGSLIIQNQIAKRRAKFQRARRG